tara:strand:+ start:1216 stop:1692 length:477 start_codon:yes stop_codon:yes gene_type:complete
MKKVFKVILIIIPLFIFSNCGFKVVKYESDKNFNIVNFTESGDDEVNFIIRRSLKGYDNNQESIDINFNLKSAVEKKVKEKNLKNEILKYELYVKAEIEIFIISTNQEFRFDVEKVKDFKASNKTNELKYNERTLLKQLVASMSDQIIREVSLLLNDL